MKTTDIMQAISRITTTTEIDDIIARAKARRTILALDKAVALKVGDKVTFNQTIRPSYLAGLEVTVRWVNGKSVTCSFPNDQQYGRFAGSNQVRVPLSTLAL